MIDSGTILPILGTLFLIAAVLSSQMRRTRILIVIGGIFIVAQFTFVVPNLLGLVLSGLITLAAVVQLVIMTQRARSGAMFEEERELFEHVMHVEEPANQRRLRDLLRWEDVAEGETLMEQGQPQPPFIYVASGLAKIEADGSHVGTCGHGEFLGEMSLVSGQTATATVIATEPMRVARFDRDALAQLSRTVPEISKAIDAAINRGLASKVKRSNEALAGQQSIGAEHTDS